MENILIFLRFGNLDNDNEDVNIASSKRTFVKITCLENRIGHTWGVFFERCFDRRNAPYVRGCWKSFSKAGFEAICSNQCQINPSVLNSLKTQNYKEKKFQPTNFMTPSTFYHTIFIYKYGQQDIQNARGVSKVHRELGGSQKKKTRSY